MYFGVELRASDGATIWSCPERSLSVPGAPGPVRVTDWTVL